MVFQTQMPISLVIFVIGIQDLYMSKYKYTINIINHTLPSTIRAVISTVTCTSMASDSTSDSECYLALRIHVRVLLLP